MGVACLLGMSDSHARHGSGGASCITLLFLVSTVMVLRREWDKACDTALHQVLVGWVVVWGISFLLGCINTVVVNANVDKNNVFGGITGCCTLCFTMGWYIYSIIQYTNARVCSEDLMTHTFYILVLPPILMCVGVVVFAVVMGFLKLKSGEYEAEE